MSLNFKIKYSKNWIPINEYHSFTDKDFDQRFEIDRTFLYEGIFWRYRVRFVKYPSNRDNSLTVSVIKLRKPISIFIKPLESNPKIYRIVKNFVYKSYKYDLSIDEIYKQFGYEIKTKSFYRNEKINSVLNGK